NADGCVSEATSVTINGQTALPAAPVVSSTVQPTCEVATGSFTVAVAEGIEFSIDGVTYAASGSFTDLSPATYTVTARSASGCISESVTGTINAVSVPEVIQTTSADLCIEDSTFDLSELLLGEYNENGTWTDTNNTGALSNGFVDPSLLAVGTYTFDYVITEG